MYRLVLFLLLTVMLRSQTYPYPDYIGLPDTGTMVWRVATWATWQYDYAQPTFPGVYDYSLTGDSIIYGTHYRKLYRQIVQKGTYPTGYFIFKGSVEGLLGFVRNDTINKRVLFKGNYGNFYSQIIGEIPIWDLREIYPFNSYEIKSSFFAEPPIVKDYPGYYYCRLPSDINLRSYVYKVDTVNIFGKSRRRYWITTYKDSCNYYLNGWFIEGIGFEKGLIDFAYVGDWDTTWRVGNDSHFDVDICNRTGGCVDGLSPPEACYTPFSKLLCVKYDTLEHAFVPGSCDVYPPVHRQNYVPFPEDSGAVWVNRSYWGELAKYYTGNIEFINGHKYVKVYKTGIFPSGATYTYYVGKYSNDTINQIVWLNNDFNEPYYNDEIPLYVFDSQAGHYVVNFALRLLRHGILPYEYFIFPWLDKVDTLNLNNELRRRYVYKVRKSYYNFPDSNRYSYKEINLDVIEGIGLLTQPFDNVQEMGVMWQWYGVTDTVTLGDGFEANGNDGVVFHAYISDCEPLPPPASSNRVAGNFKNKKPAKVEEKEVVMPKVYPNPTESSLRVEVPSGNYYYEIYDLQGHKVKFGKLEGDLSVADLPGGVYVLKVFNSSESYLYKVVKL